MAEFNMLESVKKGIPGLAGNDYHDEVIQEYIDEVVEYLTGAGVPETVARSQKCKGVVTRGVDDLFNSGEEKASLSPYFKERAAQLALKWGVNDAQT